MDVVIECSTHASTCNVGSCKHTYLTAAPTHINNAISPIYCLRVRLWYENCHVYIKMAIANRPMRTICRKLGRTHYSSCV